MKRNMGTLDRGLRTFVVAPALIAAGFLVFQVGSIPSIICFALAAIMLATSTVSFCPLYVVPGVSTCPRAADGDGASRATAQR